MTDAGPETLDPDTLPERFALLVTARPEKGFDHVLTVAELCPEVEFVVISGQPSIEATEGLVASAELANVTVLPRTDRMDALYRRAHVVLVPSYRFVETFSRVCIEAQRHAKPVIGSDAGNVPLLLAQSGYALPEDAEAWATCLRTLFSDEEAYAAASERARKNSGKYTMKRQTAAFRRMASSFQRSLLVGVGAGIGNILHAGPMIRNIARRTGHPVDLVVSQDHSASLFLLQNPEYVNAVLPLKPFILERHYSTVFLSHCFGGAKIAFSCDELIEVREWDHFSPAKGVHETIFNLESAKALLGVDYGPEDVETHYLADLDYRWPGGTLVGIHGGSKPGHWAAKRWPGFEGLAEALKARGFSVACFGTPEERVPGTEDRTGGSIEEMARKMTDCSYFVSNDSGVMNMANALGIPVLTIFAPTDPETRRPLSARNRVVAVEKGCAPCEIRDPERFRSGRCDCIEEIGVARVLDVFEEMCHSMRRSGVREGEPAQ